MQAIGATPVGGPTGDVPQTPTIVNKIAIHSVTAANDPYGEMMSYAKPIVVPTTLPASR